MSSSIAQSILDTYPDITDHISEESAEILMYEFMTPWHEHCVIHKFDDGSELIFDGDQVRVHEEESI